MSLRARIARLEALPDPHMEQTRLALFFANPRYDAQREAIIAALLSAYPQYDFVDSEGCLMISWWPDQKGRRNSQPNLGYEYPSWVSKAIRGELHPNEN